MLIYASQPSLGSGWLLLCSLVANSLADPVRSRTVESQSLPSSSARIPLAFADVTAFDGHQRLVFSPFRFSTFPFVQHSRLSAQLAGLQPAAFASSL